MADSRHGDRSFGAVLAIGLGLTTAGWSGAATGDYASGLEAYRQGDYRTAEAEWRGAAEEGAVNAQLGMGTLMEQGVDGTGDPIEALRWYRMAAGQGNAEAQYNIGRIYAVGKGIERDLVQASLYWLQAADEGHAASNYNLGVLYYRGQPAGGGGVVRDTVKAEDYFRRAAERGFAGAQYLLGEMLRKGVNGPADEVAAIEWLTAAARQGNEAARGSLFEIQKQAANHAAGADQSVSQPVPQPSPSVSPSARGQDTGKRIAKTQAVSAPEQAPPPTGRLRNTEAPAVISSSDRAPPRPAGTTGDLAGRLPSPVVSTDSARSPGRIAIEPTARLTAPRYSLWLASFPARVDAELHWRSLQDRHPDLLGDLRPTFEPMERGGGRDSIVRLYAGPVDGQRSAEDLCSLLKRRVRDAFCTPRRLSE